MKVYLTRNPIFLSYLIITLVGAIPLLFYNKTNMSEFTYIALFIFSSIGVGGMSGYYEGRKNNK